MRTTIQDALFPKTRQKILGTILLTPDKLWAHRDLAKHLGVSASSLQRELKKLSDAGIIKIKQNGSRVFYQADTECPVFSELRSLMLKTSALVDVFKKGLGKAFKGIDFCFVYGSIAKNSADNQSDIDLMVIGEADIEEFAIRIQNISGKLMRPINPSFYSLEEFKMKLKKGGNYINSVIGSPKLFIVGSQSELEQVVS